jgi:hypothetical protein
MSGASNVAYWLESRGVPRSEALIAAIVQRAKSSHRILTDEEIWSLVDQYDTRVVESGVPVP